MNVDIGVAIAGHIQTLSDVTAMVQSRVYSDVVPQTSGVPAVLLRIVSEIPNNALDGPLGMDRARIQIDSYGRTRPEANELAWHIWRGLAAADPQDINSVRVVDIIRDSGVRYANDRAEAGSDQVRFLSSQDFLVNYFSCEAV